MKSIPVFRTFLISCPLTIVVACGQGPEPPASESVLRPVRTIQVAEGESGSWRELPAVVDAARKADLGFRVAGQLEALLVGESDIVDTGQLLARLEATDFEIQVRSRQAEYDQAHADYLRGETLVEKGVISRSDFEKLQAQDASARANLQTAQQNLEYTFLRAPFDGLIATRHVDNFEDVAAGQSIYTLQDISSLTLKVGVPESLMIRIRRGAKPNVYAVFDSIPEERFPLTIKEVSLQADERTNTFEVTLNMPRSGSHNILPGMSASVLGETPGDSASGTATIHVPPRTVMEDDDGRYVFVVIPSQEGRGIVERRPVETGALSGLGLEVVSGLRDGDRLVTAGMSKMSTGLEVKLLPETGE